MPDKPGEFAIWLRRWMRENEASAPLVAAILGTTEKTVNQWLLGHGPNKSAQLSNQAMLTSRYTVALIRMTRSCARANAGDEQARRALDAWLVTDENQEGSTP